MSKTDTSNLNGRKIHKLTFIKEAKPQLYSFRSAIQRRRMALCLCECGNEITVRLQRFLNGYSKSCGCAVRTNPDRLITDKDGAKKEHPLYSVWEGMKARCYNMHNDKYNHYGGRGIIVCAEWRNNFGSFLKWAISNGYNEGLTIDRYPDKNGNYEPSNCRWATYEEQNNNHNRNVIVELEGCKMTRKQACDKYGISYTTATGRMESGWTDEETFFTKVRMRQKA